MLLGLTVAASAANTPLAPGEPVAFKLTSNREKDLRGSPTIILPTVYVEFAIAGKVSATKQGGALSSLGGGSSNTVKAKAQWAVDGVDRAFLQELARKVQDDLAAKLRAAGYTVKTYDDIKGLDVVKAAKRQGVDAAWRMPVAKSQALLNSVVAVAAPSDEQYFVTGMAWGVFNQFIKGTKSVLGEGTILIPTFTIAAPQAWAETSSGYKTISAKANVAPGMNLTLARADYMSDRGSGGTLMTTQQIINLGEKVGELTAQDTTPTSANAISAALSALTGTGSIKGKSGHYLLTVDRPAYETAVLRGATAFNTEIAKLAAQKK